MQGSCKEAPGLSQQPGRQQAPAGGQGPGCLGVRRQEQMALVWNRELAPSAPLQLRAKADISEEWVLVALGDLSN